MGISHDQLLDQVPAHLRQYVVEQKYEHYTPRDQAVWRYVMARNLDFLSHHAHPAYLDGLKKTGINPDRIPDVLEMNMHLARMGWHAVVVDGFIPPAAFMEFQAHRILVISADMRTVEHILYTPAPDIIHEAAGHAPLIADARYAEYLRKFGEYGAMAISSKADFDVYEAIRSLSIIKEYPGATAEEISRAEENLTQKLAENTVASEAALLSRLHWWTVEYGLVGNPHDYKLYGAGLLSSVGESKACLDPKIKKISLAADCIEYDYDITRMQPQLFVAADWDNLHEVLEAFSNRMAFRVGGLEAVNQAIGSENTATVVYSSGLQVSGRIISAGLDGRGELCYLKTSGPTSLAEGNKELEGHGINYHKDGFGSPVGRLAGSSKPLEKYNDSDLKEAGLAIGHRVHLEFTSGIVVHGILKYVFRRKERILLMGFEDCTVQNTKGEFLFRPEWGMFDMAVGEKIVSVFAGSADKEKFNVLPPRSATRTIEPQYDDITRKLFRLYSRVWQGDYGTAAQVMNEMEQYPREWLLRFELLKKIHGEIPGSEQERVLVKELQALKEHSEEYNELISAGLELLRL